MGGEGSIPPEVGLFYPFVTDVLAWAVGGYVLQPEHRFYGKSQPLVAAAAAAAAAATTCLLYTSPSPRD